MKIWRLLFLLMLCACLSATAQADELVQLASYENSDGGAKSWFQLWANDSVFEIRATTREHVSGKSRKGKVVLEWTRWPDFRESILNSERRVVSGRWGRLPASEFPIRVKTLTGKEATLSVGAFYVPDYTGGVSLVLHHPDQEPVASENPGLRLENLGDPEFINLLLAGERAYGRHIAKP